MNTPNTPTPDTDAFEASLTAWTVRDLNAATDFARRLERERDALKTECTMLQIERANYARKRDEARKTCAELVTDANAITLAESLCRMESERDAARALNAKCICMYCHKEYDRNAPQTPADLSEHVMTCDKSPLVKMIAECKVLIEQAEADRARLDFLTSLDCDSPLWDHLRDTTTMRATIDQEIAKI